MSDEKQEGQKTIVSFIVGLLIGGLLVWAFSGPSANAPEVKKETDQTNKSEEVKEVNKEEVMEVEKEASTPVATLPVGDGSVTVADQSASALTKLTSVTYPISEGWIGVRDFQSGQQGSPSWCCTL